jgi:hypothetical protein
MQAGQNIPLYLQLFDYNTSKYVKALVRNQSNTQLTNSPAILTHIANGLYGNNGSIVFPNTATMLSVQYLVYDDSGYTMLSTSEGGAGDGWSVSPGNVFNEVPLAVGGIVPLQMQLFDYSAAKYVQAFVRDQNNVQIPGSPFNLTEVANGLYTLGSVVFPANTNYVTAQYCVFSDSGYTMLDPSEGAGLDLFTLALAQTSPFFPPTSIVGNIDPDDNCCQENGLQAQIVVGSDRTLFIRLVRGDNLEPFDLTTCTELSCLFLNADGTTLRLNLTDIGTPIVITSAAAGFFTVSIPAALSALLAIQNPSAFSVIVVLTSGTVVCNFPNQLATLEPSVGYSL